MFSKSNPEIDLKETITDLSSSNTEKSLYITQRYKEIRMQRRDMNEGNLNDFKYRMKSFQRI